MVFFSVPIIANIKIPWIVIVLLLPFVVIGTPPVTEDYLQCAIMLFYNEVWIKMMCICAKGGIKKFVH